jgi:hypothetical protein
MKFLLIEQLVKFQERTLIGKICRIIGKILFGKLNYITGIDPKGIEFFKTTTSRKIDELWKKLSIEGYSNLNETVDFVSAKNNFYDLRKERRRTIKNVN